MDLSAILVDLIIISLFFILGAVIRTKVKIFQRFLIPASVIGGVIGLILGKNVIGLVPISAFYSQLANVGIDVVFAGLFIGKVIPGIRELGRTAGAQTAFAYFNGFGQIAIGLAVVILFGMLGTQLSPLFGLQLVVGFQGGVGVGTAVAPMVGDLGWSAAEAAAVGETCAVAGLVMSVLAGVVIVNIGTARNFTANTFQRTDKNIASSTFLPIEKRRSIGREIISPEAGSTLLFNFGIMGLAILCGHLIHLGIVTAAPPLKFLPKFPFVLIGGIIVQSLLQKSRLNAYVDRETVDAIAGFALDALIVASLMAIDLTVVATYALPLTTTVVLGLLFNFWQVKWMGPRILPGAWFEKSVCEFGQSTGSTPQAMLLLRMMDPRLKTGAAEAFALKMFFFSPVMFPMTMILMPFIVKKGPVVFLGVYLVLMLLVLIICRLTCWQKRPVKRWFGNGA
jgi:ESS family glutamate:Na+ symporter